MKNSSEKPFVLFSVVEKSIAIFHPVFHSMFGGCFFVFFIGPFSSPSLSLTGPLAQNLPCPSPCLGGACKKLYARSTPCIFADASALVWCVLACLWTACLRSSRAHWLRCGHPCPCWGARSGCACWPDSLPRFTCGLVYSRIQKFIENPLSIFHTGLAGLAMT